MPERKNWGSNLTELLLNISSNGSIHVSEIESDLLQINLLLAEAIVNLGENVVMIGENVHRQQTVVRQVAESGGCTPFAVEKIEEFNEKMDSSVAAVVTAMQFQDMTTQLLDKVLLRVTGLQEMIDEIEKLAGDLAGAESEGDMQMMLRAIGKELDRKRKEFEGLHAQRVSQKHMDSGSIELF